jgi:hypothetical protein
MSTGFARGYWYEVEWTSCWRCRGSGENVECIDDLCHAQGRCMHAPSNNVCNLCGGTGRVTKELDQLWHERDTFESVTAPDADLWNQRKLHEVARERRDGGEHRAE